MFFQLPDLDYDFNALEPYIDGRTMEIHHGKHHAGYTKKLNAALEGHEALAEKGIEYILQNLSEVPEEKRQAVINNGGGFYNHKLFWKVMAPNAGGEPTGELANAITAKFGSFSDFQTEFNTAAGTRFGSGWAWLCKGSDGKLCVMSTANQDNPLSQGHTPLLGLDVWEHAYYLHYQNRRPEYIEAWWNLVNWEEVAKNFAA